MRRLREIWARPIPPEQGLVVYAAAAAILLLTAAVLMAIPGSNPGEPTVDSVTIETAPVQPDPEAELEDGVEDAARRFMAGYLPLAYGQGNPRRIDAASPALIEKLSRPVRVPPAARHRRQRLVDIDAGPVSAGRATATATVETGGIAYPVILDLRLTDRRWLVHRVGAE